MKRKSHNHMSKYVVGGIGLLLFLSCGFDGGEEGKQRFGLWSSEYVKDGCRVGKKVEQYFSSGTVNDIPNPYETPEEKLLLDITYNPGEIGFYKLQDKNKFAHLLEYVSVDSGVSQGCDSKIRIEMSYFDKNLGKPQRTGSTQEYNFYAPNGGELCLLKNYPASVGVRPAIVTSCTNIRTLENTFDVNFEN